MGPPAPDAPTSDAPAPAPAPAPTHQGRSSANAELASEHAQERNLNSAKSSIQDKENAAKSEATYVKCSAEVKVASYKAQIYISFVCILAVALAAALFSCVPSTDSVTGMAIPGPGKITYGIIVILSISLAFVSYEYHKKSVQARKMC